MTSEKVVMPGDIVPTEAITTDFEKLLTKFTNAKSVRYEWFLQIWREMSMSLFYAGRQNDRECREFTEECLRIASTYIQPPYQFQVRICGLYLLYALYFRHPFEPKVKIRVTLDEWKELLLFLNEIRHQQHFDVDYVFMKLRHERAFHFVAAKTEVFMGNRGTNDPTAEAQKQKVEVIIEQTSAISSIFQSDAIEELSTIHEEYHRYKCGLTGLNASEPDLSFNIINASLVHDITKIVASHENWRKNKIGKKSSGRHRRDSSHTNSESECESEQEQRPVSPAATPQKSGKSIHAIRQEIKDRAFSTTGVALQSRRHRQAHVISEISPEAATVTHKRRRKSHSGDQQNLASTEQLCSPGRDEQTEVKEVSAFGAFISPQQDEPGILSMPNLLGNELPSKAEKKKRKPSDSTASNKTPKKKTDKQEKNKKSPKDKKQKSTPDPKHKHSTSDSKRPEAASESSKQKSTSELKQLQNTPGPKKQKVTSDPAKMKSPSGKKQLQKTHDQPSATSDSTKQNSSTDALNWSKKRRRIRKHGSPATDQKRPRKMRKIDDND